MKMIRLQPSAFVDQIVDDHELTRLPYPFYVDYDGNVGRQDFWRGSPARVVGFVRDLARQEVDLWWQEAAKDPQQVVGMYLITVDRKGNMATHNTAIADVEVVEVAQS